MYPWPAGPVPEAQLCSLSLRCSTQAEPNRLPIALYPWPAGPVPDAQLRLDKKLWNSHWLTEVCPWCSTQAEPKRPPMALYLCRCPALYANLPLWDQSELLWNDGGALLKFPIFFGQFLTDRFIAETPTPTSKKGDNSWRSNFVGSPLGEKPAN